MDWRVIKLKAYIDNHVGAVGYPLEQICQSCGLGISAAYAARLFKRDAGVGIREYVKMKRLQIAAELLTSTNLPIKMIAVESGYKKIPDFTRAFTKWYHVSPVHFRRADRET